MFTAMRAFDERMRTTVPFLASLTRCKIKLDALNHLRKCRNIDAIFSVVGICIAPGVTNHIIIQGGPKLLVLKGKTWSDFSLDGVIVFAMFENDHFYTTENAEISAPKVPFGELQIPGQGKPSNL